MKSIPLIACVVHKDTYTKLKMTVNLAEIEILRHIYGKNAVSEAAELELIERPIESLQAEYTRLENYYGVDQQNPSETVVARVFGKFSQGAFAKALGEKLPNKSSKDSSAALPD